MNESVISKTSEYYKKKGIILHCLLKYANESNQVLITPHIGGMTREAQEIAYSHAAGMLRNCLVE